MFNKRSRIVAAATSAAAAALLLAGCAGGSDDPGDGGPADSGSITWWSWTPDAEVAKQRIADFNKEYPDIKVEYKAIGNQDYTSVLRPALTSNSGPDVFSLATSGAAGQVTTFAPYALDLTSAVEDELGADWKSKVYGVDEAPAGFSVDGKLPALPSGRMSNGTVWVNKTILDKYGVAVPTTLDEWIDACDTLRDNGVGCLTEGIGDGSGFDITTLHTIMNSVEPGLFTRLTTDQAKWTDEPGVITSFEIFKKMSDEGILDAGAVGIKQYPDANNNFLSGKSAMVQMGYWYSANMTSSLLKTNLESAGVSGTDQPVLIPIDFPDVAGEGNPYTMFGDPDVAQAVNAKSKSRNAATTFVLWLGANENAQQSIADTPFTLPTLAGITPDFTDVDFVSTDVQKPLLESLYDAAVSTTEPRFANLPAERFKAVSDANVAVITGQQSPKDAAAAVQAAFDANPTK